MAIKRTLRLVLVLLVFMVAFYLFFQVYSVANPSYKTSVALEYTVSDYIRCKGIAVRDEITMNSGSDTAVNYLVDNGEKVAKGASVAEIYSTETGARSALLEAAVAGERESYDSFSVSSSGNIESISGQLYKRLREVSAAVATGEYDALPKAKAQVGERMSAFLATSGAELDFSAYKDLLDRKAEEYSAESLPARYIEAEASGYFYNSVDGFEDVLNCDSILSMSAEQIMAAIDSGAGAAVSGKCKIIDGYSWYFAAVVDAEYAERFTVGRKFPLDFRYASVSSLDMTVEKVVVSQDGKSAAVIFACDYLNGDIASLRLEEVDISFRNYTGIRVNRGALKMENGELGVYVKYGTSVVFKKVDPVFETDEYIISRNDAADSETLKLYDEIIIEGKELYVGKEL